MATQWRQGTRPRPRWNEQQEKRGERNRGGRTDALLRPSLSLSRRLVRHPAPARLHRIQQTREARHMCVSCACNVLVRRVEYLAPDAPGPSVAASSLGPGPAALKHGAVGTDGRTKTTTTAYYVLRTAYCHGGGEAAARRRLCRCVCSCCSCLCTPDTLPLSSPHVMSCYGRTTCMSSS
jgi:hypothetical protein